MCINKKIETKSASGMGSEFESLIIMKEQLLASVNFICYRGSTKKKFNYNVVDSRSFFDTVVEKGRGTFYENFPKSFVLSNKEAVLYLPKSESYAAIDFVVFQEESEYHFLFKQCTTTANGQMCKF